MARVKQIPVQIGDSLQAIAQRELGDAQRWRELVTLNALVPPYLLASTDPADRVPNVLLWGDWLAVPAISINDGAALGDNALGQDVRVAHGRLAATATGDLDLIAGAANFGQALRHRVETPYQSFLPHPEYGCEIHALLGLNNGPAMMLLGAGLVRRALQRDPRAAAVAASGAVDGDRLQVRVEARSVVAETVTDFNVLYQLPVT